MTLNDRIAALSALDVLKRARVNVNNAYLLLSSRTYDSLGMVRAEQLEQALTDLDGVIAALPEVLSIIGELRVENAHLRDYLNQALHQGISLSLSTAIEKELKWRRDNDTD